LFVPKALSGITTKVPQQQAEDITIISGFGKGMEHKKGHKMPPFLIVCTHIAPMSGQQGKNSSTGSGGHP